MHRLFLLGSSSIAFLEQSQRIIRLSPHGPLPITPSHLTTVTRRVSSKLLALPVRSFHRSLCLRTRLPGEISVTAGRCVWQRAKTAVRRAGPFLARFDLLMPSRVLNMSTRNGQSALMREYSRAPCWHALSMYVCKYICTYMQGVQKNGCYYFLL